MHQLLYVFRFILQLFMVQIYVIIVKFIYVAQILIFEICYNDLNISKILGMSEGMPTNQTGIRFVPFLKYNKIFVLKNKNKNCRPPGGVNENNPI